MRENKRSALFSHPTDGGYKNQPLIRRCCYLSWGGRGCSFCFAFTHRLFALSHFYLSSVSGPRKCRIAVPQPTNQPTQFGIFAPHNSRLITFSRWLNHALSARDTRGWWNWSACQRVFDQRSVGLEVFIVSFIRHHTITFDHSASVGFNFVLWSIEWRIR